MMANENGKFLTEEELDKKLARFNTQFQQDVISTSRMLRKSSEQYGRNRDIHEIFGYKKTLDFDDYLAKYQRHSVAKAVVNREPEQTWKSYPDVFEVNDDEERVEDSEFNKQISNLQNKGLFSKIFRADKLSRIGEYGVLLIGTRDIKTDQDYAKPLEEGSLADEESVMFMQPFHQGFAQIKQMEDNPASERFGKPKLYEVKIETPQTDEKEDEDEQNEITLNVHHSRLVHIAELKGSDDFYGDPPLEPVFNRLEDINKIVPASAEGLYQLIKTNRLFKLDADADLDNDTESNMEKRIDQFDMGFLKNLLLQGVDVEDLTGEEIDPQPAMDVQWEMISTATGIPKSILIGKTVGDRANSEDLTQFNSMIETRRRQFATPDLVRKTIDLLQNAGALEDVKYKVEWPPLETPTKQEEAETNKTRAEAVKAISPLNDPRTLGISNEKLLEIAGVETEMEESEGQEIESMSVQDFEEMMQKMRDEEVEELLSQVDQDSSEEQ